MKIKSKSLFFIAIFLALFSLSHLSHALQPKLLKEVPVPFVLENWEYASHSGHLIMASKDRKRVVLFDNSGNIRWQWGPSLERNVFDTRISSDGKVFIIRTTKGFFRDDRIHYYRNGKEVWNQKIGGLPYLSPDGNLIAVVADIDTGDEGITLYNSEGVKLWNKYRDIDWQTSVIKFTSDSNYLYVTARPVEPTFYLLDKDGNILFTKKYAWGRVIANAKYLYLMPVMAREGIPENEMPKKGVYDLKGNLILENAGGLSDDGMAMVFGYEDKIKIVEFPSITLIKEYSIGLHETVSSGNERFLFGYKGDVLYIIDTETDTISPCDIKGKKWYISHDGKYLISESLEDRKLYFYQLNY